MPKPEFKPTADLARGDITLVLGQRTTGVKGHRVSMHQDVANEMRVVAGKTIQALQSRTAVAYSDDLSFDEGVQYMLVERETLTTHRPAPRRGRPAANEPPERPMVEMDSAAFQAMQNASSLPLITGNELKRKSFVFYAAVIGDDPDDRVSFVRQWNPYKVADTGRIVTLFGDGLRRIEEPILAFERDFDMVVTKGYVAVLRGGPFEKVFRDIDSMKARIPTWSAAAVAALPVDTASATLLQDIATRSARVARQMRGLYERGFLSKKYNVPDLRKQMVEEGLDAGRLLKGSKLVLEEDDVPDVLKLIDERFYKGWHSSTKWDVGTRATR